MNPVKAPIRGRLNLSTEIKLITLYTITELFFSNTDGIILNTINIGSTYLHASIGCMSFNNGHVLHLRSETVDVRRRMNMVWMIYDDPMIPGTKVA